MPKSHTAFSKPAARPSVAPAGIVLRSSAVEEVEPVAACRSLSPEERDEYAKTLAPRHQSERGKKSQRSQNRQRARLKTMEERKAATSLQGSPDALSDLIATTEE